MITFNLGKLKVCLDFTFFAVIALFLYFDKSGYGLMGVLSAIIHESGHLFALMIERKPVDTILFYGGGIRLSFGNKLAHSYFVITSGIIFNLVIFAVCYFAGTSFDVKLFGVMNLIIGLFNLLPLGNFDGRKLLEKFAGDTMSYITSQKFLSAVTVISTLAIFAVFPFFVTSLNFTAVVVAVYLAALLFVR
jgi:stage IV sporulation protein FB